MQHHHPVAHLDADRVHLLVDHLHDVGDLTACFAKEIGAESWGRLAGRWHDLGKYSAEFGRRIRILNDPHTLEVAQRVDHSTAGALHAMQTFASMKMRPHGIILAYLIAGHHAGLADFHSEHAGNAALQCRLGANRQHLLDAALAGMPPEGLLAVTGTLERPASPRALHLWMRMLFSALVDADRLDTEKFFRPHMPQVRSQWPDLSALPARMASYIDSLPKGRATDVVNAARASLLADCRNAASQPPGIYTLTAPTGSGKTAASATFALDHAVAHGKRRVIYVIPYISITEQTADAFRSALAVDGEPDPVLEHHSAAQDDGCGERRRLATENWDAPVVVTTAVQFFESLFASSPGRCRKLHNIANSVVVLDEAQTLPVGLLDPIMAVLDDLVAHCGTTVVLCTATQPELQFREDVSGGFPGLRGGKHGIREIVSNVHALHNALRRVMVVLPPDLNQPTTWPALADEIMEHRQGLAIVDRRKHAAWLWSLIPGALHLSAAMCGQHRADVIAEIRRRLDAGEECRVVSTQLIEAGVDLDFPIAWRALAGLDSLAQSAGRVNRNGMLDMGELRVFVPPDAPFDAHLRRCAAKAKTLLQKHAADPFAPAAFRSYFRGVYWSADRDSKKVIECLVPNNEIGLAFATASERFKWIDDSVGQVVVRYGEEGARIADALMMGEPDRALLRKAQRYSATLRRGDIDALLGAGRVVEVMPGLAVQVRSEVYHPVLGIIVDGAPVPEAIAA